MQARFGVKISPAVLNNRSHAALAGSGVFVFTNTLASRGHAKRADVALTRLARYSSSWSSAEWCLFRAKKSSSSSLLVDGWRPPAGPAVSAFSCRWMYCTPANTHSSRFIFMLMLYHLNNPERQILTCKQTLGAWYSCKCYIILTTPSGRSWPVNKRQVQVHKRTQHVPFSIRPLSSVHPFLNLGWRMAAAASSASCRTGAKRRATPANKASMSGRQVCAAARLSRSLPCRTQRVGNKYPM